MESRIKPFVKEREVWDIGAGDLTLAHRLWELGAKRVIAVDKEPMPEPWCEGVRTCTSTLEKMLPLTPKKWVDVAFVSWPPNYSVRGVRDFLDQTDTIIYLGLNSERAGTACGGPAFWRAAVRRPLLSWVTSGWNNLLIYGPGEDLERKLHIEEVEAYEIWFPDSVGKIRERGTIQMLSS